MLNAMVLRIQEHGTYAALFAVIGTTYGAADSSHFNVPDLREVNLLEVLMIVEELTIIGK